MYGNVNLSKPSGSAPGGAAPKNEIVIVDTEILDVYPASDADGVLLLGQFVFKPGKSPIKIYSTKSKTEADYETSGDEDSPSISSKLMLQHPGNKLEVKEFVQRYLGRDVIVMHKACGDDFYEVMGTPCAPLQLKASKKDGNDGRFHTLTFEPFAKSNQVPKHYTGSVAFADPFNVTAVATTAILKANGTQYKLPVSTTGGNVTITACDLDHNQIVTLLGGGGSSAAIVVQGISGVVTIALVNSTTWVGISGAVLNLQVFKAGAITYLKEISRS